MMSRRPEIEEKASEIMNIIRESWDYEKTHKEVSDILEKVYYQGQNHEVVK